MRMGLKMHATMDLVLPLSIVTFYPIRLLKECTLRAVSFPPSEVRNGMQLTTQEGRGVGCLHSVVQNNVDKLDVNIIAARGHPTSQPERHILATSYTSILFTLASRPRSPKMGMICKLHLPILLSAKWG